MAGLNKTYDVGDDASEKKLLRCRPSEIIVDQKLRGREFPPTEDDIKWLAADMLEKGQEQNITVRRVPQEGAKPKVKLVSGFSRWEAAMWIEANPELSGRTEFFLNVDVIECNDQEALQRNISENLIRNNCSVIDDAHNHRRLREECNWTDQQIATKYRTTASWVGQIKNLLSYPENVKLMIHRKILPVGAALKLVAVDPAIRDDIFAKATNAKGRINGTKVTELYREYLMEKFGNANDLDNPELGEDDDVDEEDEAAMAALLSTTGKPDVSSAAASGVDSDGDDEETAGDGKKGGKKKKKAGRPNAGVNGAPTMSRSIREVRNFCDEYGGAEEADPAVREMIKKLRMFIDGKVKAETFRNAFYKLQASEPIDRKALAEEEAAKAKAAGE